MCVPPPGGSPLWGCVANLNMVFRDFLSQIWISPEIKWDSKRFNEEIKE